MFPTLRWAKTPPGRVFVMVLTATGVRTAYPANRWPLLFLQGVVIFFFFLEMLGNEPFVPFQQRRDHIRLPMTLRYEKQPFPGSILTSFLRLRPRRHSH
jgi:hypothetical protein